MGIGRTSPAGVEDAGLASASLTALGTKTVSPRHSMSEVPLTAADLQPSPIHDFGPCS